MAKKATSTSTDAITAAATSTSSTTITTEAEKEHSPGFEKYKKRYDRIPQGCRKDQLLKLVEVGLLYDWEYEEITGEPYPTPNA